MWTDRSLTVMSRPVDYSVKCFNLRFRNFIFLLTFPVLCIQSLTLLIGRQERHPTCKKLVTVCWWWWFKWNFTRVRVPAVAITSSIVSCCNNIQDGLTFRYRPAQVAVVYLLAAKRALLPAPRRESFTRSLIVRLAVSNFKNYWSDMKNLSEIVEQGWRKSPKLEIIWIWIRIWEFLETNFYAVGQGIL